MRSSAFNDPETVALQAAVKEEVRRIGAKPYLRASSFVVVLKNGDTPVQHGLRRKPVGWMLHTILGNSPAPVVKNAPDAFLIVVSAVAVGSCVIEVW